MSAFVVTITMNPSIDKSSEVDKLYPESKMRAYDPKFEPGGGGINVSRAIKRIGGDSLALVPYGGHTGKLLLDLLSAEGVRYDGMPIAATTRQNFIVVDKSTNHQYRFGFPGPEMQESEYEEVIKRLENLSPRPDYIVASGSMPPNADPMFLARIAKVAKKLGARFILDSSGEPLKHAVNEGIFLFKPSVGELGKLAGISELKMDMVEEVTEDIIERGNCEAIVVSLGPAGATLYTKHQYEHLPAPTVKKQSTVGAGDSMVGGMVWSLARGDNFRQMLRFGIACGTAATMNKGTALCDPNDVNELYNYLNRKFPLPN